MDWIIEKHGIADEAYVEYKLNEKEYPDFLKKNRPDDYKAWVRHLGGIKNVLLRELTKDKKKA